MPEMGPAVFPQGWPALLRPFPISMSSTHSPLGTWEGALTHSSFPSSFLLPIPASTHPQVRRKQLYYSLFSFLFLKIRDSLKNWLSRLRSQKIKHWNQDFMLLMKKQKSCWSLCCGMTTAFRSGSEGPSPLGVRGGVSLPFISPTQWAHHSFIRPSWSQQFTKSEVPGLGPH